MFNAPIRRPDAPVARDTAARAPLAEMFLAFLQRLVTKIGAVVPRRGIDAPAEAASARW